MDRKTSGKIITRLKKEYGDVKSDLEYNNLYQLTVAVVLSAQTTDVQVNSVTPVLFRKYPNFKSLSQADTGDVENIIRSTGFYRNKSKNIVALAREITEKYKGRVPSERELLEKLPGIGRKSTNVIISMGYNIPALAVDTHVARIAGRLGYTDSKDPYKIEKDLNAAIPEKDWIRSHLLFIRHGRSICKARNPLCRICPISLLCPSVEISS
jgi:endonuclease III